MAHVRQQIRDYVATLLTGFIYDRFGIVLRDRAGNQLTDGDSILGTGTIYKFRRYALDESQLPALCVYTTSDITNLATIGERKLEHSLELRVDIINKGSSLNIFENIEQFAADLAQVVGEDYDFGGLAKSCVLTSSDFAVQTTGEKAVGTGKLIFDVRYMTAIGNSQVSV